MFKCLLFKVLSCLILYIIRYNYKYNHNITSIGSHRFCANQDSVTLGRYTRSYVSSSFNIAPRIFL